MSPAGSSLRATVEVVAGLVGLVGLLGVLGVGAVPYHDTNAVANRQALVEMLEWRWADVAAECERYLGPMGYAGAQVSPPGEHLTVTNPPHPWWQRYQPVSYTLISRSGNEAEFADMVKRCNQAGVRIIVDAVINHMVGQDRGNGTGTAGNPYNADTQSFPGVPYSAGDFNSYPNECPDAQEAILNWDDPTMVRNCRLVGLLDLKTPSDGVRQKIAGYLNHLIDIGVGGIRIDAAKHIWPADLQAILGLTKDLNPSFFPPGSRLLVYQEVIDWGNSPISSSLYLGTGRVTSFEYGQELSQAIRGGGGNPLAAFINAGPAWGWLSDGDALNFVDNHDNQRGHGVGNGVLTFEEPFAYKLAVTFMLALPYGLVRVMSSYSFTNGDQGPPSFANFTTAPVPINPDGSCGGGWVCEHRWPEIGHMAKFRWVTAGEPVLYWTTQGDNAVGFARGSKGFYAINKDNWAWSQSFQTNLPAGQYCDVISGDLVGGACTGQVLTVDSGGRVRATVGGGAGIPVVAIHVLAKLGGYVPPASTPGAPSPGGSSPAPTLPSGQTRRTVVFLRKTTFAGEDVFIRGGISHSVRPGCNSVASTSPCAIPIQHITVVPSNDEAYTDWAKGDAFLDWYGPEPSQGTFDGGAALGTPLAWSTNDPSNSGYQPLNRYGSDYWIVDVMMDCSRTQGGWFELKGFLSDSGWENDVSQPSSCSGTAGGSRPYQTNNHMGRCGFVNVFDFGTGDCQIDNLSA